VAVNAITIAKEEAGCSVEGERMKDLLRGPFCGWMRRDVEVNDAAALVRENDENVEGTKGKGRGSEEIDGSKLLGVVFKKCAPGLRGRLGMSDHVLGDGGLGNIDAKFEQFPVNSGASPERVRSADFSNEVTDFWRSIGAPALGAFPFPEETKSSTMPCDDRLWLDDDESRAPLAPEP